MSSDRHVLLNESVTRGIDIYALKCNSIGEINMSHYLTF